MHSVTFHNIGNADCVRINLENGRKVLFDYANMRDPNDDDDLLSRAASKPASDGRFRPGHS